MARRQPSTRPRSPLERWQTVLAAVVAALGAVAAAVIAAAGGDGNGGEGNSSSSASASAEEVGSVTINGFDLLAADPDATVLRFFGTASGVVWSAHIYVVAQPRVPASAAPSATSPAATASPGTSGWFAAGPAERPTEDSWRVDFEMPRDAPPHMRFFAVVPQISCWPPDQACAEPPGPEAVRQILEEEGPVGRLRSPEFLAP